MTSTPLIWEEKEGVWKAEAKGFRYFITRKAVICDFGGISQGNYFKDESITSLVEDKKEICQSHADAIAGAIADAVSEERKLADRLANGAGILFDACNREKAGKRHDSSIPVAMTFVKEAVKAHAEARK